MIFLGSKISAFGTYSPVQGTSPSSLECSSLSVSTLNSTLPLSLVFPPAYVHGPGIPLLLRFLSSSNFTPFANFLLSLVFFLHRISFCDSLGQILSRSCDFSLYSLKGRLCHKLFSSFIAMTCFLQCCCQTTPFSIAKEFFFLSHLHSPSFDPLALRVDFGIQKDNPQLYRLTQLGMSPFDSNRIPCYLFLRAKNKAAPAKVMATKPAIGEKSPVLTESVLAVIASCPV